MKMKYRLILMGLMACVAMNPVLANQMPKGLATDKRVKIVSYDSNDIVSLHGSHLVSTAIFLNPQEKITSVNVGDAIAWEIVVSNAKNVLFVKPKLPESDTNMTILTDKRVYRFHIFTQAADDAYSGNAIYSVQFNYPEEELRFKNKLIRCNLRSWAVHLRMPSVGILTIHFMAQAILRPFKRWIMARLRFLNFQNLRQSQQFFQWIDIKTNRS